MRIALVEDNLSLAKGIAYQLRDNGHSVDMLHHGDEASQFLSQEGGDLIILDVNLPGRSGLEILADLRRMGDARPVILLTARGELEDRITGLDAGADDYLVKPFEMAELAARIRALARRRVEPPRETVDVGPLTLDLGTLELTQDAEVLDVPRRELVLLAALARANGRSITKSALLDQLYGAGSATDEQVIEVYASRLRKRLKPHGVTIKSRRGLGYALAVG